MSVQQYQNTVNRLDKEIAELEKKKAVADAKSADEMSKAHRVNIPSNASATTIKSKESEIARHIRNANNASKESADISKKIAGKREERRKAFLQLQSEEQKEEKKRLEHQKQEIANIQSAYEERIEELQSKINPIIDIQSADNAQNGVYHSEEGNTKQYDVFMSHATEDKEDFVDEFVDELRSLGINVWYDTSNMNWGDSLRHSMDEGLKKAKYGIVVLSPDYIAEGKYWTKAELDALFQMESNNRSRILPIWHKLSRQQVLDFSPIIANRKALKTSDMTAKEMAEEFARLFSTVEGKESGE